MTKLSIISGFLGAGKTTLIKKLLREDIFGHAPILVENDYGALGIDGAVMAGTGVQVEEMTSGCICCSLVGNFVLALEDLIQQRKPEHVIIEPSGAAKLSEIVDALTGLNVPFQKHVILTAVDAKRFSYHDQYVNEYFWDQILCSDAVALTKTDHLSLESMEYIYNEIKSRKKGIPVICSNQETNFAPILENLLSKNKDMGIPMPIHSPKRIRPLSGKNSSGRRNPAVSSFFSCRFGQRQKTADQWDTFSAPLTAQYERPQLHHILEALNRQEEYGTVLRAKGIFACPEGPVLLDYVPEGGQLSPLPKPASDRVMVIGKHLNYTALEKLFGLAKL